MQKTIDVAGKTIGEIVTEDYRTASVFEKHGIDFCCGGNGVLSTVCKEKGIDLPSLAQQLDAAKVAAVDRSQDYARWSLSFLADYIVNTHHGYLNENMASIAAYAHKIARVHGAHHPEVIEIAAIFDQVVADLAPHLLAEEDVCFPAIKRLEASQKSGISPNPNDITTVRKSLAELHREHDAIGAAVHRIRHLSKDYAIPDDACNTFRLTYQKLREFEDDLHKHVHLENNILFRKVDVIAATQ